MVDSAHISELTVAKGSQEPILDFLKDPKAHGKASAASEAGLDLVRNGKPTKNDPVYKLEEVTFLPPVSRPSKIICMGGNFSDHLSDCLLYTSPSPRD